MQVACITGITGQTGSYLAELLLDKGYSVYGLKRRSSSLNTDRINHIFDNPNLQLMYGDVTDSSSLSTFVADIKPDLFFNCAAQSHVQVSFEIPVYTMEATGTSVFNCLEAIRKYSPKTRFITMSSSEMFGKTPPPQNEESIFRPRSPYAVAKVAGYYATINYRESYNMFACNAICFNHESKRRGETFVTRKITRAATRIKLGLQDKLYLGNLYAHRDWSHAADVAEAMYQIVTSSTPDNYVVSSGEMHSVREFLEIVFNKLDLDFTKYVMVVPKYFRYAEVDALCGDSTKLRTQLGWTPKYSFSDLIDEMIDSDMELARNEKILKESGR
jgi:GDPmannose 4,6-dehydratase